MEKRRRRTAKEIRKLRSDLQKIVKSERRISLTDLVRDHGAEIGIRDTVSDKNLAKRQLDILASGNDYRFQREGRDLVASWREKPTPAAAPARPAAAPAAPAPEPAPEPAPAAAPPSVAEPEGTAAAPPSDLAAIRAYVLHVEAFAKTLQHQLETLAEMLDRASR
ncbi:MAG: hypothetical protein V3T83_15350 [Acidobacteriota bacterium]